MNRQSGEGKLGCILWIVLLALAALVASKMIPVKIASVELKGHIEELAKISPRAPIDKMTSNILNKAKELDLPVSKKDIKINRTNAKIRIQVAYTVPLDFSGLYQYDWHIEIDVEMPIFYI